MTLLDKIVATVIDRIPYFGGRVEGAVDVGSVKGTVFQAIPACYVIPNADDTEPNRSGHEIRQRLTRTYSILVVVSNTSDPQGHTAYNEIERIRQFLWQALLNWQPDPAFDPLAYAGSQFVDINKDHLIWRFDFETETEIGPEDGYRPNHPDFKHVDMMVDLQPDPIAGVTESYPTIDIRISPIDKEI